MEGDLTVGGLRKAIASLPDEMTIVVRATVELEKEDVFLCCGLRSASVADDHDSGELFLALDAGLDDDD